MWPWEHLAVGYILLSLYSHGRTGTPPAELPVLTLTVATQLPDLIDKPLAWQFDVMDGTAVAHSIVVSLLLVFVVGIVTGRIDHPTVSSAFAIGYFSHLLGDLVYPMIRGQGHFAWGVILWPGPNRVVTDPTPPASGAGASTTQAGTGFLSKLTGQFGEFVSFLGTPVGRVYLLFEVILVTSAAALWFLDGRPGMGIVADYIRLIRSGSGLE
ncbi:metal-dependent hydrolase [Halosimplex amylolyticum]|uniref:metal-dependent hydrolase n=1 Tax=Halosimplex amylolyticum TaxID=3396616 RepID=UPI003F55AB15